MRGNSFVAGANFMPYAPIAVSSALDVGVNTELPVSSDPKCLVINGPVAVASGVRGEYLESWALRFTRIANGLSQGDPVEAEGSEFVSNAEGRYIIAAVVGGGFGWIWPKLK